jgi:hypothetical protein
MSSAGIAKGTDRDKCANSGCDKEGKNTCSACKHLGANPGCTIMQLTMHTQLHVSSLSLCSHRRVTRDARAWFRSRISFFSLCSSGDPPLRVCAGPPKFQMMIATRFRMPMHAACPISPCGPFVMHWGLHARTTSHLTSDVFVSA